MQTTAPAATSTAFRNARSACSGLALAKTGARANLTHRVDLYLEEITRSQCPPVPTSSMIHVLVVNSYDYFSWPMGARQHPSFGTVLAACTAAQVSAGTLQCAVAVEALIRPRAPQMPSRVALGPGYFPGLCSGAVPFKGETSRKPCGTDSHRLIESDFRSRLG